MNTTAAKPATLPAREASKDRILFLGVTGGIGCFASAEMAKKHGGREPLLSELIMELRHPERYGRASGRSYWVSDRGGIAGPTLRRVDWETGKLIAIEHSERVGLRRNERVIVCPGMGHLMVRVSPDNGLAVSADPELNTMATGVAVFLEESLPAVEGAPRRNGEETGLDGHILDDSRFDRISPDIPEGIGAGLELLGWRRKG